MTVLDTAQSELELLLRLKKAFDEIIDGVDKAEQQYKLLEASIEGIHRFIEGKENGEF